MPSPCYSSQRHNSPLGSACHVARSYFIGKCANTARADFPPLPPLCTRAHTFTYYLLFSSHFFSIYKRELLQQRRFFYNRESDPSLPPSSEQSVCRMYLVVLSNYRISVCKQKKGGGGAKNRISERNGNYFIKMNGAARCAAGRRVMTGRARACPS